MERNGVKKIKGNDTLPANVSSFSLGLKDACEIKWSK